MASVPDQRYEALRNRRAVMLLLAACGTAALARFAEPTNKLANRLGALRLNEVVPDQVGLWSWQKSVGIEVVNPQRQAAVDAIYSQVLNRVYAHRSMGLLMLAIAYGEDQRDGLGVHYPEVCYPAQGFQVSKNEADAIVTPKGRLPVRRLVADQRNRHELVTYWTTVGQHASLNSFQKKRLELGYSLRGYIPDGLLFRVSSIEADDARAFSAQDDFVNSFVLSAKDRVLSRLTGLGSAEI